MRGYINGEHEIMYPAFTTYGEARAKQAQEQQKWPNHKFIIKEGMI